MLAGCGGPRAATSGPDAPNPAPPAEGTEKSAGEPERLMATPPDFELDTLDGGSLRLSDHLGSDVILIDFWATYCDPCLASMPHLDALYRKYRDEGFVVLGISIDGPDSVAQVRTEVAKMGITFPILLDRETRVVALYNPRTSAPYSVLIGRDGRVLSKKEGYTTGDAGAVERDIQAALGR
jgi:peroxiredoxin